MTQTTGQGLLLMEVLFCFNSTGHAMQKMFFAHVQNAHMLRFIQLRRSFDTIECIHGEQTVFALHGYILWYQIIMLTDNEGPHKTTRMRSMLRAFALRICSKTQSIQYLGYIQNRSQPKRLFCDHIPWTPSQLCNLLKIFHARNIPHFPSILFHVQLHILLNALHRP